MNNRGNIQKGWLIFVLTILFTSNIFTSNVKALEVISETPEQESTPIEIEETTTDETIINTESKNNNSEEEITIGNNTEEETTDNEEFLEKTKEEIFTSASINMNFQKEIVTIKGNINDYTTVKEVLENINIEKLNNYYSLTKVGITNEEDIWLEETDFVTNLCHIIFISNDFVTRYQINFLGDLNQDTLITEVDIETGINQFFEESAIESEITPETITEEVSYIAAVIKENTYEVELPTEEEIINIELENTDTTDKYPEDKVIIELKVDGFINNYINTISGQIKYNNEILELENIYIQVEGKTIGNFKENQFIYILDNYQSNNYLLIIVFKSLKSGTTTISLEELKILMNGQPLIINKNTNIDVTINEYGKGGDIETPPILEPIPENKTPTNNTNLTQSTTDVQSLKVTTTTSQTEEKIELSNDNYIKYLKIIGHEILFDKDTNKYSIEVKNDIDSLTLAITLNNENASYIITGNEKFKTGQNEIIITVFAENGTSRDYILEVTKKEVASEIEQTSSKSSNKRLLEFIILTTLIIITLVTLIYRLVKKDD